MRLGTTPVCEVLREVDASVEVETSVVQDVDVQRPEIRRCVDQANVTGLQEIIRDHKMLLVGRDLEEVRSHRILNLIWIVETLDIVEVGDVKGRNMVASRVSV